MGFMIFNKEKAKKADNKYGVITPGKYEVFVTEGSYRAEAGKTPNINLQLVVRSDIEQEYKGRKVFHTFWISDKSEAKREACLNMMQSFINKIGAPDGVNFETPEQWIEFTLGKPITAQIEVEEYNGKERNIIKYFNVSDQQGQAVQQEEKQESNDPFKNDGQPIDITDEDLPF
jgi:hypothetical protein